MLILRFEHFRNRRITLLNSARRPRDANGRHASANGQLPHDECGAAGSATGLAVVIGEEHAVFGDGIDVRGAAHHAVSVSADVPHADVIAPDDDDVGFLVRRLRGRQGAQEGRAGC